MYTTKLQDLVMNWHQVNEANQLTILRGYIGFAPIQKI